MKKTTLFSAFFLLLSCGISTGKDKTREEIKVPVGTPGPDGPPVDAIPLTFTSEDSTQTQAEFEAKVAPAYKPIFDGSLEPAQKTLIQKDLIALNALKFKAAKLDRFSSIFADPNNGGILNYLSVRMKILVGADAQVFEENSPSEFASSQTENFSQNEAKKAFMTAQNLGTLLWYNRVIKEKPIFLKGSAQNYEVKSMHDGVIMFLDGYLTTLRNRSGVQQRISSPATLIHEARHSDCSVQLSSNQIAEIHSTKDILKGDLHCGHLHVACPVEHPLAGLNACDNDYWGAYSVSGYFSQMVEVACENCSTEDIAVAKMAKLDSLSRVLPVLSNQNSPFPAPNMSHFEAP
jgi:hypothetical protein